MLADMIDQFPKLSSFTYFKFIFCISNNPYTYVAGSFRHNESGISAWSGPRDWGSSLPNSGQKIIECRNPWGRFSWAKAGQGIYHFHTCLLTRTNSRVTSSCKGGWELWSSCTLQSKNNKIWLAPSHFWLRRVQFWGLRTGFSVNWLTISLCSVSCFKRFCFERFVKLASAPNQKTVNCLKVQL